MTTAGPEWDEQAVLMGLRRGDDDAYAAVLRRYGPRMLATARRLLRNEEEARDAVQEAMLSAFKAASRFAGDSLIGTWLHRIVVNAALMRLRARRRKPEVAIDDLLPSFHADGHRVLQAQGDPYPDQALEQSQLLALLRACVPDLPEVYREVYVLRDIEELSSEEVALAMGLTPNAVKIRLHRARQALITLVQRRYAAGACATAPDRTR